MHLDQEKGPEPLGVKKVVYIQEHRHGVKEKSVQSQVQVSKALLATGGERKYVSQGQVLGEEGVRETVKGFIV